MRRINAETYQVAIVLAGGAASGKSTSVRKSIDHADVVFDSNCAHYEKGCRLIDAAVAQEWGVLVVYVHRNFRVAVESMLCRAIENGRFVRLFSDDGDDMAHLHLNAQRTFIELQSTYSDDPGGRVRFFSIRNPWTPDNPAEPTRVAIETLATGGKRHYTSIEELYAIEKDVVSSFLQAGKLSQELCRAVGVA